MGLLDVWVARPGAACLVDEDDWVIRIDDAHMNPYSWAGTSYAALPAPNAHWAGTIPPGTYVISATRSATKKGEATRADAAIVEVFCDGVRCVRLFVNAKPPGDPDPPDDRPNDHDDDRENPNEERPRRKPREQRRAGRPPGSSEQRSRR